MVIDVSKHNGVVNFTTMPDVTEVICRATIGIGTVDSLLTTHAQYAKAAGKLVSYYHFAYPHSDGRDIVQDASAQGNFLADTIVHLPTATHLCVDLEEYDDKGTPTSDSHLSPVDYSIWLKTFLDTVQQRTGIQPLIYSYRDYLDRHLPHDHTFGTYGLWLASYSGVPHLPIGWNKITLWQYSEHGAPGVPRTDIDVSKWG